MKLFPENTLAITQFDEYLKPIAHICQGVESKLAVLGLRPQADLSVLQLEFTRMNWLYNRYDHRLFLSLQQFFKPAELNRLLTIEDFVMTISSVMNIRAICENHASSQNYFELKDADEGNSIDLYQLPFSLKEVRNRIVKVFDDEGEVLPNASPELVRISSAIKRHQLDINKEFNRLVKTYSEKGLLSENKESIKGGRRVLALPTEKKRMVEGVLHGESESGKTAFIEPVAVTRLNNGLIQLEIDKKKEVYRILKELSAFIKTFAYDIEIAFDHQVIIDVINAKAWHSHKNGLKIPICSEKKGVALYEAKHPILEKRMKQNGEKIVSNDIVLSNKDRCLLVSGPNAGGKSVLLKTLLFNQLLFQTGLPICAAPHSELGVFEKIFIDIGDKQSIEDDLSTYSAHLTHMNYFLEHADNRSLMLIDEFGTGTDPRVGGAMAESILHGLMKKGVMGVITTHYSNLKVYAHKNKHVTNAAMSFDMEEIKPTYQLIVGQPGSSFAFEIAKRIGLPESVIHHAKKNAGSATYKIETLLSQNVIEKERLGKLNQELERKQSDLNYLQNSYKQLKKELDIQRKKLKAKEKTNNAINYVKQQDELKSFISKIEKEEQKKKAQEKLDQLKELQQNEVKKTKAIRDEIHTLDGTKVELHELKKGMYVKVRETEAVGIVEEVGKRKVRVTIGGLTLEIKPQDIRVVKEQLKTNSWSSVQYVRPEATKDTKLDLRGMKVRDAEEVLIRYLDDVLVSGLNEVKIIHGKGSGAIRKMMRDICRKYKFVKDVLPIEDEGGGVGSSIVRFK